MSAIVDPRTARNEFEAIVKSVDGQQLWWVDPLLQVGDMEEMWNTMNTSMNIAANTQITNSIQMDYGVGIGSTDWPNGAYIPEYKKFIHFRNNGLSTMYLTVYECTLRQDFIQYWTAAFTPTANSLITPLQAVMRALFEGLTQFATPTTMFPEVGTTPLTTAIVEDFSSGTGVVAPQDYQVNTIVTFNPFMSSGFCQFAKVIKTSRVVMEPGHQSKYVMDYHRSSFNFIKDVVRPYTANTNVAYSKDTFVYPCLGVHGRAHKYKFLLFHQFGALGTNATQTGPQATKLSIKVEMIMKVLPNVQLGTAKGDLWGQAGTIGTTAAQGSSIFGFTAVPTALSDPTALVQQNA